MTASAPCLADVFPLCCRLFFTFWVTPENESAKRQLRRFPCFSAGFSGAPKGCLLHLASAHPHRVHKSAVRSSVRISESNSTRGKHPIHSRGDFGYLAAACFAGLVYHPPLGASVETARPVANFID